MKLTWTTDPHLDHASLAAWEQWIQRIASTAAGGLLLTGDLSEADDVTDQLKRLAVALDLPIYFVLGNHDFYRSSIAATRRHVVATAREDRRLHYLTDESAIEIKPGVFILGDDGWGDATEGDFESSSVRLNDFRLIDDFCRLPPEHWQDQLRQLGSESAQRLQSKLATLPAHASQLLVLTHVPPFRESCWYEGHTTDDHWAPFFVCGQVGQVLRAFAKSQPGIQITVLCGHTHHRGLARLEQNLVVHTGGSRYGEPDVEAVLEIQAGVISVESGKLP